jgi:hypothetical protein
LAVSIPSQRQEEQKLGADVERFPKPERINVAIKGTTRRKRINVVSARTVDKRPPRVFCFVETIAESETCQRTLTGKRAPIPGPTQEDAHGD